MDSIRPSDRNRAGGAIADLVQGGVDFASQDNPPVKMLLDMFGVPGLARTLNRMSYGQPLTNASQANVPLIPQDTADAAMLAVPALAKGVGGLAKSMPQVPSLARRGEGGAIRIGGREDLALTHAFPLESDVIKSIASQGDLKAPSLGITKDLPNQYAPDSPQFLFKAGSVDVPAQGGTLINRDGYFGNPTGLGRIDKDANGKLFAFPEIGYDPVLHKKQLAKMLQEAELKYSAKDLRLLQGTPEPSQALSIATSPTFKNFEDFEKSALGVGALKKYKPALGEDQPAWNKLQQHMGETMDHDAFSEMDVQTMYQRVNQGLSPGLPNERAYTKAWNMAEKSPSAMAEWKVHSNLPVTPDNAAVYLPETFDTSPESLAALNPLRDKGHKFFTWADLNGQGNAAEAFPRVAAPDGTFKVPPISPLNHPDYLNWIAPPSSPVPWVKNPAHQMALDAADGKFLEHSGAYDKALAIAKNLGPKHPDAIKAHADAKAILEQFRELHYDIQNVPKLIKLP